MNYICMYIATCIAMHIAKFIIVMVDIIISAMLGRNLACTINILSLLGDGIS